LSGRERFGFVEVKCLFSTMPEAKKQRQKCYFLLHRTLPRAAPDAGASVRCLLSWRCYVARCTGASEGFALDAGHALFSIRCHNDISSFLEPSCAPNAVASIDPLSDVSSERKSSLDAYWSASDAWRRMLSTGHRMRLVFHKCSSTRPLLLRSNITR
jgi:hypothetical protein